MKTWIKLYTEILDDFDQDTLTWAQRGIWAALLALAGRIDDRDDVGKETGRLDTEERVAWALRCSGPELNDALAAFTVRGMVEVDDDGILWLPNYARRQCRAPSSRRQLVTERVKRHRAMNTRVNNDDVTRVQRGCNEDVTRVQRSVTPSDADTDTDAEADAEADAPAAAAPRAEPEVAAVVERWEGVVGREATSEDCLKLREWLDQYGAERVNYAIGQAHVYGAPKLAYVWRILADGGAPPAQGSPRPAPGPPHTVVRRETTLDRSKRVLDAIIAGGSNGDGRNGGEGAATVGGELAESRGHARNRAALPSGAG